VRALPPHAARAGLLPTCRRRRVRCAAKGITGRITYWKDGQELEITEDEMPLEVRPSCTLCARVCARGAVVLCVCAPSRVPRRCRLRAARARRRPRRRGASHSLRVAAPVPRASRRRSALCAARARADAPPAQPSFCAR
jgi:hypothetical protein